MTLHHQSTDHFRLFHCPTQNASRCKQSEDHRPASISVSDMKLACEINTANTRPIRILQWHSTACPSSSEKCHPSSRYFSGPGKTTTELNLDPGFWDGNMPSSWKGFWFQDKDPAVWKHLHTHTHCLSFLSTLSSYLYNKPIPLI